MSIDPGKLTADLTDSYSSYLRSRFFFKDARLRDQFSAGLLRQKRLCRGPYIELTPPFREGATPRSLIDQGILDTALLEIPPEMLHTDRELYLHQQRAIERLQAGRNVIVATGTGSGKTETYLLPILSHILSEMSRQRSLRPGIRALLVYPMNALANDQLKRIRHLLRTCPGVTFGRYIGDTPHKKSDARGLFRQTWPEEPDLPNELKSREEMWADPPHILLTNFAMLEYLLVRPQESVFFDPGAAEVLRFLVLDEIHTYDGAKGTEIAMLLRRLKQRVGFSEPGLLRCIGTSATLGGGRDLPDIADFASKLFDEPFVYDPTGPSRDVVEVERKEHPRPAVEWGPLPAGFYKELAEIADLPPEEAGATLLDRIGDPEIGIPEAVQAQVSAKLRRPPASLQGPGRTGGDQTETSDEWDWGQPAEASVPEPTAALDSFRFSEVIHDILAGDTRLHVLRESCKEGPKEIETVLEKVFPEESASRNDPLGALLQLLSLAARASTAPGSVPLLTSRYHFFLRALEGCFVCLEEHEESGGGPRLYLERRKTCLEHPETRVFEVGVCRRCGEEILVGSLVLGEDESRCVTSEDPTQEMLVDEDDRKRKRIFLALHPQGEEPVNEDEIAGGEDENADLKRLYLCLRCGELMEARQDRGCKCAGQEGHREVVKVPARGTDLKFCPSCGSHSRQRDILQTVYTGPDEPVAEMATSVFQTMNQDHVQGRADKKKLLTFSDSRQDAAYFAPYLETVYRTTLRRHVIFSCLEGKNKPVPLEDLAASVEATLSKKGWLPDDSEDKLKTESWRWVIGEVLHATKDRRSLEELGLIDFELRRFPEVKLPPPLLAAPWNLSEPEAWTLVQILLDTLRDRYVMTLPANLKRDDEVFAPGRADVGVALKAAKGDQRTISWVPQRAHASNTRLDFLKRLARAWNLPLDEQKLSTFLEQLFERYLTDPQHPVLRRYFDRTATDTKRPLYFQLAVRGWVAVPPVLLGQTYRCSRCGVRTRHNLADICPTFRCDGRLEKETPGSAPDRSDHYQQRYREFLDLWMVAREHTAQLDSVTAAGYQNAFYVGGIDVLSCSTTFELGVDLGELESILMRNMPPSPANYAQRAGRAGRRLGAASFVVTYAQRRSHDLTHYGNPLRMISGRVRPPAFRMDNERIVRRHVYATALGAFFQHEPAAFGKGKACDLFGDGETRASHVEALCEFLRSRPPALLQALTRIVPQELHENLGIARAGWLEGFLEGAPYSIRAVYDEYTRDRDHYRKAEEEASRERHHSKAGLYQRTRRTIENRHLLGVLANRGLFPKYGFPVDVVNLEIRHDMLDGALGNRQGNQLDDVGLELSRDMKLAIAEYAPGSEVVAGGFVWKSVGLKVMPDRSLEEINYFHCPCGAVQLRKQGEAPDSCDYCGQSHHKARANRYVRPEFGFVTGGEQKPSRATTRKPGRQYTTRVSFTDYTKKEPAEYLERWRGVRVGTPQPARLVSINMGKARRGFRFCQTCGFAEPLAEGSRSITSAGHPRPRGGTCKGTLSSGVDLGNDFITDVLEFQLFSTDVKERGGWWSVAYAIVEGATTALGIRREDLDVTVRPVSMGGQSVYVYDAVPGGAGHVVRVYEHLSNVLQTALKRVASCSCEETTSCYECLRTYANQRLHSYLERGIAKRFLESALRRGEGDAPPPTDWPSLIQPPELRQAVHRFVETNRLPAPEIGYEITDDLGAVMAEAEIAWPETRVAIVADTAKRDFRKSGWNTFVIRDVLDRPDRLLTCFRESAP